MVIIRTVDKKKIEIEVSAAKLEEEITHVADVVSFEEDPG